mgnify:CR=1 FL=1
MLPNLNGSRDAKGSSAPGEDPASGSTRAKGEKGEETARTYLKRRGFKIMDVNYRTRGGEIDIVAREKDYLVFVEVKASSSKDFDDPLAWIPPRKQDRIVKAAVVYVKAHRLESSAMRFDVVTVDAGGEVTHIRDAFRPSERFFV